MPKPTIQSLLPKVRRVVLEERAKPKHPRATSDAQALGLSWLVWQVSGVHVTPGYVPRMDWNKYTSGGPKNHRGLVQACLAVLAREGIMFSRTRPECAVQSYEHGERDKYFRIRISREAARQQLKAMK